MIRPCTCSFACLCLYEPGPWIQEGWYTRFHCHCISDCIWTGRWGAPWFWFCSFLDTLNLLPGLFAATIGFDHSGLHLLQLSVWVGIWIDWAFLDQDQAAGERFCIYFSQPQAWQRKTFYASVSLSTGYPRRKSLDPLDILTRRSGFQFITGTVIFSNPPGWIPYRQNT